MAEVQYRVATPDDIPAMVDLFIPAVTAMLSRHGIDAPIPPAAGVAMNYEQIRSTGIFHLAEIDKQIVAIAGAIVRGPTWFLAGFWARVDQRRQGIGMPLLRRVWDAGIEAGAKQFFVWSSPDTAALASYMKMGMLPLYSLAIFHAPCRQIPAAPEGYEVQPLAWVKIDALDQEVRGASRPIDHAYCVEKLGIGGKQVVHRGEIVGFYYASKSGIGPAAWTDPEHARAVLGLALADASALSSDFRICIPGPNQPALRLALECGMELRGCAHILSTAPIGDPARYIPSGPSFY